MPYWASKRSSKIESSKVFEHNRPMVRLSRRATLPALRVCIAPGAEAIQPMPDDGDSFGATLDGLV